jgi:UDP-2,3-diacylglucosamine pyrophosphatase LpxH
MKILSKKKERKRKVEVVVISDVHLGSSSCHALELLDYLKSIKPKKVILNGDIVDFRQFGKSHWPKSHMRVFKYLIALMAKGVQIEYITGNQDEMLHQFALFKHGFFRIQNNLLQELDGKKCWIFHGDVFDVSLRESQWSDKGYSLLLRWKRFRNFIGQRLTGNTASLSPTIRKRADRVATFVRNFEQTCAGTAIANGYHYVLCGHIHHPEIRTITTPNGQVTYLNSGDWVENLTALEYYQGEWHLYHYYQDVLLRLKKGNDKPESQDGHRISPPSPADMNWKRA